MNEPPAKEATGASASRNAGRIARLASIRPRLLSFSLLHLRDLQLAEDTVQEAMLSAIENGSTYSGRSGYETWVFGILKYKILDAIQDRKRHGYWHPLEEDARSDVIDRQLLHSGRWHALARPSGWGEPESMFENEHFWQVFDACMQNLSDNLARVFLLRELMGLSTRDACREMGIGENHCAVLLYRARLKLRGCIESRWLTEAQPC